MRHAKAVLLAAAVVAACASGLALASGGPPPAPQIDPAAAELGLDVPADLSVAGFDDVPAAGPAGLTTIRQPLVAKGEAAARLLAELQAGGAPRRVMLPVELVVRGSTGPPPPGAA